jgi:hypothetical protein
LQIGGEPDDRQGHGGSEARRVWSLASAASKKQDLHRCEENVDVQPDGDVLDIEKVVGQFFFLVFESWRYNRD